MKSFLSFVNSKLPYERVAIGKFDGMHKAHKYLLGLVGTNGCALSIASVKPPFITPPKERTKYTHIPFFRLRFESIKSWDSMQFLQLLFMVMPHLKCIVIGYDFHFGKDRMSHASDLYGLLKRMGKAEVQIKIVAPQTYLNIPLHTSIIKDLLKQGEIQNANAMLERFYHIKGRIIKGQGIGSKELYPTINMKNTLYFVPKHGVYATFAYYNGMLYNAVSFVGNRFSTDERFCIETHIINETINTKHNEVITIFFVAYLRDNKKFLNLNDLKIQIESDITDAKEKLSTHDRTYCRYV